MRSIDHVFYIDLINLLIQSLFNHLSHNREPMRLLVSFQER